MKPRIATMLNFPPSVPPTDEMLGRLASRHEWVWIKTTTEVLADQVNLLGPADFSAVRTLADRLHARNPALRIGMYVGGYAPDSHHPHYAWLGYPDLLHYPDPPGSVPQPRPLVLNPAHSPAEPGARRVVVPNYASRDVRSLLIDRWAAFLDAHRLDGVFFDTFNPRYMAAWMRQAFYVGDNGCLEGPAQLPEFWAGTLSRFTSDLRMQLAASGREVWANGLVAEAWQPASVADQVTGRTYTGVVDYAGGVLAEHAVRAYASNEELRHYIEAAGLVNTRLAPCLYFFQPYVLEMTDPTEASWRSQGKADLHRFFLAEYLLLAGEETLFGYHDGEYVYRAMTGPQPHRPYLFDGGADWDRDYGRPLQPATWRGDGIATRPYGDAAGAVHGYAIVNCSAEYRQVNFDWPVRIWDRTNGPLIPITAESRYANVTPRAGWFAWKSA